MTRLAAYQPDIAPNLGALIRIAACFGVGLDVIEPCGFPVSDKTLRRAAMDYGKSAEITRHDDWNRFLDQRAPGRLVLLTTKGAEGLWDFAFQPTDILLLGRESAGVPETVAARADARVRIPMPGGGRSLNVAVSGAVALAEALRQAQA
ncbi:MAG: tRNA (cytidine(34)-2'-O)-methyltransferase [Pseudomonadota bacterium]